MAYLGPSVREALLGQHHKEDVPMRNFTEDLGFVIGFLVSCLLLSIMAGDLLYPFLWLVLIGMVLVNWQKISIIWGGSAK